MRDLNDPLFSKTSTTCKDLRSEEDVLSVLTFGVEERGSLIHGIPFQPTDLSDIQVGKPKFPRSGGGKGTGS